VSAIADGVLGASAAASAMVFSPHRPGPGIENAFPGHRPGLRRERADVDRAGDAAARAALPQAGVFAPPRRLSPGDQMVGGFAHSVQELS